MGALASTLHPWQGELMILVIAIAELIRWRENRSLRRLRLPVATLVLTGLPLLYYLLLGHLDLSWGLAREASRHSFPFSAIAIGIAPLAIVAALGYRGRPRELPGVDDAAVAAGGADHLRPVGDSAERDAAARLQRVTAPLAVLAVLGVTRSASWERLPRKREIAAVVVALATIPANVYLIEVAHTYTDPTAGNANFITHDEHNALAYLRKDPDDGGVLTQFYLGEAVPGATGRRTLVGDCLWSEPRCMPRSLAADALFKGKMSRAPGARFRARQRRPLPAGELPAARQPEELLGSMIVDRPPLRLRRGVRPRRLGPAGRPSGRIDARCGCSRSEAPIASRATKRPRSSRPQTN